RTQAVSTEEPSELHSVNQELEKEVASLRAKLELSQRAIAELEGTAQRDQDSQAELQQLRKANEALISEMVELKGQLQTSEARAREAIAQQTDAVEGQRASQKQIAELEQRLTESQQKLRDLEASQQNLANPESLAALHSDEQRQWEAKVAELDRQLASARNDLEEVQTLRMKLAESERRCQALGGESRRQEEEIRHWQARSTEGDENRKRLSALCGPFNALLAKHAELKAHHHQFEEDLDAFGGLMGMRIDAPDAAPHNDEQTKNLAATVNRGSPSPTPLSATMMTSGDDIVSEEIGSHETLQQLSVPVESLAGNGSVKKRKRRFGVFSLALILPMAAALAYGLWNSTPGEHAITAAKPTATAVSAANEKPKQSALLDLPHSQKGEATLRTASKPKEETPAKKESPAEKARATVKPEPRVAGTYEITQASRVYAAPTEFSQLLGDIEPGVKVNVVNARDGWLEIHSKNGRPPGFIRKEAARIARN
ncbi:MAG TPA: hypothetical protein VMT22_07210, partial [Terriglobales bacterium]|nr:hypothetical protein [Terriglobales bacterium]